MGYIIKFFLGTCKIDKNCTCTIKLIERENGTFVSEVYRNHYGHESEFGHIWLTTSTRQQIAAKLQQGISKEKILDDIRESVGLEFQREHLVGKRDLFNIEKAFSGTQMTNVVFFHGIQEWEGIDDNPIVFYKLQGQLKEEAALEKDDFIVIMQTEFQKHLMQKFGSKGLCCDTTHGTTGYDFKLNSLLVLDEFEEGVPVAFCLSNRDNFAFMKLFFSKIRDNTGAISHCWFMSDTALQFYEAFALVNECSLKQFICVWHVDKAWKKELRGKVKHFESQIVIYKYLRIALEQTVPLVFETERFANYFQSFWVPKAEFRLPSMGRNQYKHVL